MNIQSTRHRPSVFRRFLQSEAAGGVVLMVSAALALVAANSPLADHYLAGTQAHVAGLTIQEWVNDGLMAVFFLFVGLEIKRETLHGRLRTWKDRALPGLGALGGMLVPALVFAAINWSNAPGLRGWGIPAATDIAFALGVLSLLGDRVPASLKVFLTALAVLDDLGAVLIIALFYSHGLSLPLLGLAGLVYAVLLALNGWGVTRLWPFLLLGVALLALVWGSGVHSTVAGVLLALSIPAGKPGVTHEDQHSPLHRLEHGLATWVAFGILPAFAFVNAGVAVGQDGIQGLLNPITIGVAGGLVIGKQAGVLGSIWIAIKLGIASRPAGATWAHVYGIALLCGIGFTMSLFIGLLAFRLQPQFQDATKMGVLIGSLISACAGALVLRLAKYQPRPVSRSR